MPVPRPPPIQSTPTTRYNTGHHPLWNEVKFIDLFFFILVIQTGILVGSKDVIHVRFQLNNTTGEPYDRRTAEVKTKRNSEDRKAPIAAVENQPITAEHRAL